MRRRPSLQTGLASGQTYYYVVTAVNAGGESPLSAEVSASLAPAAPTSVSAVSGNAQVTIDWNGERLRSHVLQLVLVDDRRRDQGHRNEGGRRDGTVRPQGCDQRHDLLLRGHGRRCRWRGRRIGADFGYAAGAGSERAAGCVGHRYAETTKSVTLAWSPPTSPDPIVSYTVYRSTTPGIVPSVEKTVKLNAVSPYIDLVPAGQTTYYYVVTATTAGVKARPRLKSRPRRRDRLLAVAAGTPASAITCPYRWCLPTAWASWAA